MFRSYLRSQLDRPDFPGNLIICLTLPVQAVAGTPHAAHSDHVDHGGALRRDPRIVFQDPYASLNPRWTVNGGPSPDVRVLTSLTSPDKYYRTVVRLLDESANTRHNNPATINHHTLNSRAA
jgi:ABC-type microcin C transport system duplicated ATPase subunit YejF